MLVGSQILCLVHPRKSTYRGVGGIVLFLSNTVALGYDTYFNSTQLPVYNGVNHDYKNAAVME